jgi:uncharacterized membrane protein
VIGTILGVLSLIAIIGALTLAVVLVGYRVLLEEWPWQTEAKRRERMTREGDR